MVQICQKVREYADKNDAIARISESKILIYPILGSEFAEIMENLVEKETYQANKNLAGYSMRKNAPQKIMFQKEEVISEYITFLSKSPAPVFEPEP